MSTAADAYAALRSRRYLGLLLFAAILGVPVTVVAYWFLALLGYLQRWAYQSIPNGLGWDPTPAWWPLLPLALSGAVVGLTVRYLPGAGGESPADGFKPGGIARPAQLPGIVLAAAASVGLGAVIGPEAPLIAIGGGLAFLVLTLRNKDRADKSGAVVAATGSFAAISTLLGSPLVGAFLLMEASGLGGAAATAALIPGLLGAGTGALIFLGLDSLSGHGTYSLAIPHLPAVARPTGAEFAWAVLVGLAAGVLCWGFRRLALLIRPHVTRQPVLLTTVAGLVIAALGIGYAEATGHSASDVLFSGQATLPSLVEHGGNYSVGALLLILVCKGLAYAVALASFRGGPTFPSVFLGAAGGIAVSHLPGLPLVAGAAIGMGAMLAGMLRLPLTSVLLTTLFLGADGVQVMPVVIVAVVVSYVLSIRLAPPAEAQPPPSGGQVR